jgi:MFS family permease
MATLEQEGAGIVSQARPRLGWQQILAISVLWFGVNFHWAAINIIILPSQVAKIVGDLDKGTALAFVVVPGAFISLVANPFFGLLSDRTGGRFARWGRRRPYILIGTFVNVLALIWMALAWNIPSLIGAYALLQFSSNAVQAAFHALLPDIVPKEQRGLASGIMGLLLTAGNIAGVIIGGLFVNSSKPLPAYQQGVWLAYGLVIVVLTALMVITIYSVRERPTEISEEGQRERLTLGQLLSRWLQSSAALTIGVTLLILGVTWGLIAFWNAQNIAGFQIDGKVQQFVYTIIATVAVLYIFDFRPRRDPDFAWVLGTRLTMMLGIYLIQTFLQYYMHDAVGAAQPESATTFFVIIVSITSLFSAFGAGWLSDHFGRKRMVYVAGGLMALVGTIFVITHDLTLVLASGALFGLGYGAYGSVDWALVADVLPSDKNYARDMGVWNIANSLPQVLAPVLGGPVIDYYVKGGQPVFAYQVLFSVAIAFCVLGTITVRFIKGVKN